MCKCTMIGMLAKSSIRICYRRLDEPVIIAISSVRGTTLSSILAVFVGWCSKGVLFKQRPVFRYCLLLTVGFHILR